MAEHSDNSPDLGTSIGEKEGTVESTNSQSNTESATGSTDEQDARVTLRLIALLVGMSITIFAGALDMTIVSTATPSITDHFNSALDDGWYGAAYLMTLSAMQLLWGHIYLSFPAKITFLSALAIIEIGSLVSATATSSASVIIGRVIAAIGVSGIFCGAFIIISFTVPLRFRPLMNAGFGILIGGSQAAGPVVSGAFTSYLSWRWCFWINLPVGAVAAILILIGCAIKEPDDKLSGKTLAQHWTSFDYLGLGLWIPLIVCLTLILQLGGQQHPWNSGPLVCLYVLMPLLLIAYIFRQWKAGDNGLTPGRIMTQRSMITACLYMLFIAYVEAQIPYFLPIYFQTALRKTAIQSGVATLPTLLTLIVFFIIAGAGTSAFGYYVPFMLVGSAILSGGAGLLSTLSSTTPTARWIGYQILSATGLALGFDAPQIAVQTVFGEGSDVVVALTVVGSFMTLGGSLGVSTGTVILNSRVQSLLASSGIPGISDLSNSGLTSFLGSLLAADQLLVAKAYGSAMQDVFHSTTALAAASFIVACFMEWRSVKGNDKSDVEGKEEENVKEGEKANVGSESNESTQIQ